MRKYRTYILILFLLLCGCQDKENIHLKETAKAKNEEKIVEKQTGNKQKQERNRKQQDKINTKEQGMEISNTDGFMITIDGQVFHVITENKETVSAFMERLPMTLTMDDLHGNEKYYYLKQSLPTSAEHVKNIKAGDIMLFGDNCLVIFYESFPTTYSYTRIGKIKESERFVQAVKEGSLRVTFQK